MVARPLSNQELAGRADLIIEARVLRRSAGRAVLSLERVTKGEPRLERDGWLSWFGLRRAIVVSYRSQPPRPVLGDWCNEDVFLPGNRVRGFLVWDEGRQCYKTVWWNGACVIRP